MLVTGIPFIILLFTQLYYNRQYILFSFRNLLRLFQLVRQCKTEMTFKKINNLQFCSCLFKLPFITAKHSPLDSINESIFSNLNPLVIFISSMHSSELCRDQRWNQNSVSAQPPELNAIFFEKSAIVYKWLLILFKIKVQESSDSQK